MAQGFAIAALVVAILGILVPVVTLYVIWISLLLVIIAGFLGERSLSIAAALISLFNLVFLSPVTWVVFTGEHESGGYAFAAVTVTLFVLSLVAIIFGGGNKREEEQKAKIPANTPENKGVGKRHVAQKVQSSVPHHRESPAPPPRPERPKTRPIGLRSDNSRYPDIPLLPNEKVVVGRSRSVEKRIDNTYVSAQHFSVEAGEHGEIIVTDLSSTNGTYIDARKLDPNVPHRLRPNQRLIVGSEDVVYTLK